VTSTIRSNNWLGIRISAYGRGLRSSFRFSGSVFRVTVHFMQTRSY